jgi:hypothetical protein
MPCPGAPRHWFHALHAALLLTFHRHAPAGFLMMFVLFLICGVAFPQLVGSATGLRAFQTLYFLTRWVTWTLRNRCQPAAAVLWCHLF